MKEISAANHHYVKNGLEKGCQMHPNIPDSAMSSPEHSSGEFICERSGMHSNHNLIIIFSALKKKQNEDIAISTMK